MDLIGAYYDRATDNWEIKHQDISRCVIVKLEPDNPAEMKKREIINGLAGGGKTFHCRCAVKLLIHSKPDKIGEACQ